MGSILLFTFIAVPIIEIGLFIKVGGYFGFWPTIGIVILTAIIGTT
ncbi:MAG: FxsA family protein, partial [Rhodospirillales bacterium]